MIQYITRKILISIPLFLIIVTLVFFVLRLVPGGPAEAVLGNRATAQAIRTFNERWGLNRPLFSQYLSFLRKLFQGNLGRSYIGGAKITPMILRALPFSIVLALSATFISVLIGIPAGIISALNRNSLSDNLARVFALFGLSMPDFYLGIVLIILFSLKLSLLPMRGAGEWSNPIGIIARLIMPAVALGLASGATVMRITRSSMLEVLSANYISTARSKGLNENRVVWKHALRNSLIPVLTVVGVNMGLILGNVVIIEIVFSRPGLGKLLIGSVMDRDFAVIQSTIVIFAGFITLINLLTDIAYGVVNPKIQYD